MRSLEIWILFSTQLTELVIQIVMLRMILNDKKSSVDGIRELIRMIESRLR